MHDILDRHYKGFAKNYDRFLLYSPDFVRTLTKKMIDMLALETGDLLVDLGGGTGMYSLDILRQVPLSRPPLCVDAYQEMLDKIPDKRRLVPVRLDALAFSESDHLYTKVLMKEAVHHVADRPRLFRNIFNRLPAGGRLLLVHVPPVLQYPIFQRALDRAKTWHANPAELADQLKNAGFVVERDSIDFPHRIDKNHYFDQIRSRFMSVLHHFSDDEMDDGLREMDEKYGRHEILEFLDHFDYVLGVKK